MQTQVVIAHPRSAFKRSVAQAVVVGSALIVGTANAAIDVAPLVATIGEGVIAAGVIGLAFLAFKGGIAVFKSLRSAA